MWEPIIHVGGEGGSLTLKGKKLIDGNWLFTRIRDEGTLTEFLSEGDLLTLQHVLKAQSQVVAGFEEGLRLLNSSWVHLYPLEVHPEFCEKVWETVSASNARNSALHRWADVCFDDPNEASKRYAEVRAKRG